MTEHRQQIDRSRQARALLLGALLGCAWPRALCAQTVSSPARTSAAVAEVAPPPQDSEPPPAPLEEPEPDPAPLRVEKTPEELAAERAAAEESQRSARRLRTVSGIGWFGVALTAGGVVAGTTLGILAQGRSDAASRLTTQRVDGMPPIYDAAQDREWARLHDEGPRLNSAAIGCLIVAGVVGVATGVVFWQREKRFGKELALSLPSLRIADRSVGLSLGGRF